VQPRIGFHVASVHSILELALIGNSFSPTIGQKRSKANYFQGRNRSRRGDEALISKDICAFSRRLFQELDFS
jgi:hypothetical protein